MMVEDEHGLFQDPGVPGRWRPGEDEQEAGAELDRCGELEEGEAVGALTEFKIVDH